MEEKKPKYLEKKNIELSEVDKLAEFGTMSMIILVFLFFFFKTLFF